MVICNNESWPNKGFQWSIHSHINQLFKTVCVCVCMCSIGYWSTAPTLQKMRGSRGLWTLTFHDPVHPLQPQPAKACLALNVSCVYMYCWWICVLMCLCDQPAALCALTFTEALSGPINSQAVRWPFTSKRQFRWDLRGQGSAFEEVRPADELQRCAAEADARKLIANQGWSCEMWRNGMKTLHETLKIQRWKSKGFPIKYTSGVHRCCIFKSMLFQTSGSESVPSRTEAAAGRADMSKQEPAALSQKE